MEPGAYGGSTVAPRGAPWVQGRKKGVSIPAPLTGLLVPPSSYHCLGQIPLFSPFPGHAFAVPSSSTREAVLSVLSDLKDGSVSSSLRTHQRPSLRHAVTRRLTDHQMLQAQRSTDSACPSAHGTARGVRPRGPRVDSTGPGDSVLSGVSKHSGFPQCPAARQNILCQNVVSPKRTSVPIDIQR